MNSNFYTRREIMPATIYDNDADLGLLKNKTIAAMDQRDMRKLRTSRRAAGN